MLYAEKAMYEAFKRTEMFFFKPFDIKKWLKLSFVGLLGGIVQQAGGSIGSGFNGSGYDGSSGSSGSNNNGSTGNGGG